MPRLGDIYADADGIQFTVTDSWGKGWELTEIPTRELEVFCASTSQLRDDYVLIESGD